VQFEVDNTEPVEADASALAEAAIGGASNNAATAVSGAATLNNATSGTVTSESLSTAVGAIYTLTLTSNLIKATSLVFPVVSLGSSTQGTPCAIHVTPAQGSVQIRVKNIDSTNAFNGTLKIGFAIFQ
jgi:hypothetical protein